MDLVHVPITLSIAVIVATVGGPMAYSMWKTRNALRTAEQGGVLKEWAAEAPAEDQRVPLG